MGLMSKRTARALLPLLCAFLLLIAVAAVTASLVTERERDVQAINRAMKARSDLLEAFSTLQDAETGQRGFLLKEAPAYLVPYVEATRSLDRQLDDLDAGFAGSERAKELVRQFRSVAVAKMAELKRTVDLVKAGDRAGALAIVGTDEGLHLMERARLLSGELAAINGGETGAREQRAHETGKQTEIAVALAVVAAMMAASLALHDARRREMQLLATNAEREAAIAELAEAARRREKLEGELHQAQKMEIVGQLTGGLAHDFNNMLAIIIGSLNMMGRRIAPEDAKLRNYVAMATEGAERAANLTNRLLSFARRQPLAPTVLHLNKVLPGLSELLRRTLGEAVQIETVLAGGLWYVEADANQLENAIINLAVNARDAMPDGGKLTVETGNAHLDDAYAAAHAEVAAGQYVMVALTDTGTGMTPAVMSKAFEPFFTTKAVGKGTGLGLSQVYGFVKQSGGHVALYSEPGRGTTVRIYLPRCLRRDVEATLRQGTVRDAATELPRGEPRKIILVVEDEEGVRRLTVDALRELDYTVIHAADGSQALRICEGEGDISLLLTDVVMPVLTGKQLVDRARLLRPDLKALYMTGYTRNSIVHNGAIDPGVQLISKPFTIAELATKVRECIDA